MAEVDADLITEQNEKFKRSTGNTDFPRQVAYRIAITAPSGTAVTAGDELAVFQLPVGSVVRPELSTALFTGGSSLGGVSTITIGDVTDPNRYMLTEDVTAAQIPTEFIHTTSQPAGYTTPYTVPAITDAGVDDGRLLVSCVAIGSGSWAAGESIGTIDLVVDLP
jgi:hypothetical protein